MDKMVSIVRVDTRPYRTIAQENWGLTDEQMRGMHVHHRIHRSKGGTNDPTNLYVCSPSFHSRVWHNGEEFIEWSLLQPREVRVKNAEKMNSHPATKENRLANGKKTKNLRYGDVNHQREAGSRQPREVRVDNGRKGAKTQHSQRWMSTDPDFPSYVSTPTGLSNWQRARGIDISKRVRIQ